MPIWKQDVATTTALIADQKSTDGKYGGSTYVKHCPYCATFLTTYTQRESDAVWLNGQFNYDFDEKNGIRWNKQLKICNTCGWWCKTMFDYIGFPCENSGCATLKNFDQLIDVAPLSEIKQYLAANFDQAGSIHPRRMEELVASIFKAAKYDKYDLTITSYSNDGGIDILFFNGSNNETIGIQVKRYKNKIGVADIREFAGSLFINAIDRGVFVTTGQFTRNCNRAAGLSHARGIPIELVNRDELFKILKISTINPISSFADWESVYGDFDNVPTVITALPEYV